MKLKSAAMLQNKSMVEVVWQDETRARFHAIWLRDNALDADTRSPENGQRLITLLDIPKNCALTAASVSEAGELNVVMAPEMKHLTFSGQWLKQNAYDGDVSRVPGYLPSHIETWTDQLQTHIPTGQWAEISNSGAALKAWLTDVHKYGFAVLQGIPLTSGGLCQVAETFGYVRETNYGRWFEVRSEVNPSNLAYTNLGLQAHTDNPYRDPVPTLQLLSCLENTVEGGQSIVVDGFRVAERLREEHPEAFELLSKYRAEFEYTGSNNVKLQASKPMIELAAGGELMAIRFNNRSAAPLKHVPFDQMTAYYAAYRQFAEYVEDSSMQLSFKLSPGELFIVDNTRVLHARKAFSGSGHRWLQGCYADKDGLRSTLAVLEEQHNEGAAA